MLQYIVCQTLDTSLTQTLLQLIFFFFPSQLLKQLPHFEMTKTVRVAIEVIIYSLDMNWVKSVCRFFKVTSLTDQRSSTCTCVCAFYKVCVCVYPSGRWQTAILGRLLSSRCLDSGSRGQLWPFGCSLGHHNAAFKTSSSLKRSHQTNFPTVVPR